jgi:hypothetical protein
MTDDDSNDWALTNGPIALQTKVEIPREVLIKEDRFIKWTQSLPLPPGLYQVRVAVRDRQTGQDQEHRPNSDLRFLR